MGGILTHQGFANFMISFLVLLCFFMQLLPLFTQMNNVNANFWVAHLCWKSTYTGALYSKFWMEITCQVGSAKWFWACTCAQVAEASKGLQQSQKAAVDWLDGLIAPGDYY
jgi:hypothetical protein